MLYIFGLIFVALFTYAACMMEHQRILHKINQTTSKRISAAKNDAFKDGWNKCYEEMMPRVNVGDLKMTRETLAFAQSLVNSYCFDSLKHVRRLGNIIREIDKLRPLGPDGKHGNLHTEFCGCEDK